MTAERFSQAEALQIAQWATWVTEGPGARGFYGEFRGIGIRIYKQGITVSLDVTCSGATIGRFVESTEKPGPICELLQLRSQVCIKERLSSEQWHQRVKDEKEAEIQKVGEETAREIFDRATGTRRQTFWEWLMSPLW